MKQRRLIFATGGYIPFARTKAERALAGDPRLSLEERYGNRQGYVCVVRKAVQREVGRRFLLAADGERLIAQAASSNVLAAGEGGEEAGAIAAGLCRG